MATKTRSYNSKLSYSAAGSTYTDLTDMALFTPPSLEAADVKISHLESANHTHEYIAGWIEPGEITGEAYFTKAQWNTLLGLLGSTTDNYYWKFTFPLISGESTASTLICRGHLKKIAIGEINIDDDGKIMAPIAIKVTAKPTFSVGT